MEIREFQDAELGLDGLVHSMKEPVFLLFFCVDVLRRIASEVVELGQIFADGLAALSKCQKFLLFIFMRLEGM